MAAGEKSERLTEIVFRVYGVPLPQAKISSTGRGGGGKGRFTDEPIRLRHPATGQVLRLTDELSGIPWPNGFCPSIQADRNGEFWLQRSPRLYWTRQIQTTAELYMRRRRLQPFPPETPLVIGTVFFLPRPETKNGNRPMPVTVSDLDNFRYPVWNGLKKGLCFHDDAQLAWEREGGKVWASPGNPPGAIIWIRQVDGDMADRIAATVRHYTMKVEMMERRSA